MKNTRISFNNMSFKTGICLILVGLLPLLIYVLFIRYTTFVGLNKLETSENLQSLKKTLYLLKKTGDDILNCVRDYAIWDDMYHNVSSPDYEWLNDNLINWIPKNFDIDSILLINNKGDIIAEYNKLSVYKTKFIDRPEIKKALTVENFVDFLVVPEGIFLIAVSPVSTVKEPIMQNGMLLFARKIDSTFLQTLERQFDHRIALESEGIGEGFIETVKYLQGLKPLTVNNSTNIQYHTLWPRNDVIATYTTIKDIQGKNINVIISKKRVEILATISYIDRYIVPAILIGILFAVFLSFFLSRYVILKPFDNLRLQLLDIKNTGKVKYLKATDSSEINDLIYTFNEMSASLEDNIARAKLLELQSKTDTLTGLYGYRFLNEYLNSLTLTCKNFSILFCDLDLFKQFNETYGHVEGDKVLREVARSISSNIQNMGTVTRYGGEEFLVILPDINDNSVLIIAEQIRKSIQELFDRFVKTNSFPYVFGVSIGVAVYPDDSSNIDELIANADKAMYYAKQMGRNQVQRFNQNIAIDVIENSTKQIREELLIRTVKALAQTVDLRDSYTGKHSEAVSNIAFLLAREIGLPESECRKIKLAGLLHDMGKIGIPDHLLLKNEHLFDDELSLFKTHAALGANILQHLNILEGIGDWVRYHHERFDGHGYPDGIKGEQIPLGARIITLADSYHAMISDRPYRKGLNTQEVITDLIKNKAKQFDPVLVDAFITIIPDLNEK